MTAAFPSFPVDGSKCSGPDSKRKRDRHFPYREGFKMNAVTKESQSLKYF